MKKIIFILMSFFFILVSCDEDVFDRKPLNKISDSDVWDNPDMLNSYLIDLYSRMPFNNRMGSYGVETKTDVSTDKEGNDGIALAVGAWSRTSDLIPYWDYSLIRAINIFIEKLGNSSVDESRKKIFEGEARVLRAMVYFEKQMRYGGVPLVDIPLDPFSPVDEKYTKRSTEEAIADFINADLDAAITLLPEGAGNLTRINKWSAYALKARATLWSASIAKYGNVQLNGLVGIPSARANDFYTKASDAANKVILSGKYSLYKQHPDKAENYRQLFLIKDNGEAIYSKHYDGSTIYHEYSYYNQPATVAGGRGGHDSPLYDYILACENIDGSSDQPLIGPEYLYDYGYQAFENKDPRVRASIIFDGDELGGTVIRTYEGIDPSPTPDPAAILSNFGQTYNGLPQATLDSRLATPVVNATGLWPRKKIADEIQSPRNSTPWMEYRLGEMYLIRAEAEFELGNLQDATSALNAIRERAGISLVDQNTITLNHVRNERLVELAWENHRWWDLRRWRIAENVLHQFRGQGLRTILHYQTGKIYYLPLVAEKVTHIFRSEHYYNPITDSRINNNVNLVENPGY